MPPCFCPCCSLCLECSFSLLYLAKFFMSFKNSLTIVPALHPGPGWVFPWGFPGHSPEHEEVMSSEQGLSSIHLCVPSTCICIWHGMTMMVVVVVMMIVNFFLGGGVACREACGILVPQPGIEPGPLAVRVWSPNHWTAKEFQ